MFLTKRGYDRLPLIFSMTKYIEVEMRTCQKHKNLGLTPTSSVFLYHYYKHPVKDTLKS